MKKYILGSFAVALALALSAFSTVTRHTVQEYEYIGNYFTPSDVKDPLNWINVNQNQPETPADCNSAFTVTCHFELPAADFETIDGKWDPTKIEIVPFPSSGSMPAVASRVINLGTSNDIIGSQIEGDLPYLSVFD